MTPDFLLGVALGFAGGVSVGLFLDAMLRAVIDWYIPHARLVEARLRRRHGR